jgi:eukaryotic-like serine/threonine-protein kinase
MSEPSGPSNGQAWPERPDTALGLTLGAVIAGKYRVDRVIGKGGMGVVVAACQLALDRTVAIKLIRADCAEDPLAVERLLREAKAAASITSEHVARVLDVGMLENGVPFIVMEYLDGSDLHTLLEREGPLPAPDAVDFLLQACEAIAEAHRNGIVHRDIKPANVFVARMPGGVPCVKVVDFGISKVIGLKSLDPLTQPSSVVGSLYHMAPEQMRGLPVDARTDVWALGLLLFEMLTGRKPFRDGAWPAVCAQILSEAAPVFSLPSEGIGAELGVIIERCLRRSARDRYGNVAELAVALAPFGGRSARVSLERIVRLATSTGSLSADTSSGSPPPSESSRDARLLALDSTRPVPVRGLVGETRSPRRVSPNVKEVPSTERGILGFARGPHLLGPRAKPGTNFGCEALGADTPRSMSELPWQVRLSTPTPIAAPPSAPAAAPSRARVALGGAIICALVGSALLLLWPSPIMPPDTEQHAPLRPLDPLPAVLPNAPMAPVEPAAPSLALPGAPPAPASGAVQGAAAAGGATSHAEVSAAAAARARGAASVPAAAPPAGPRARARPGDPEPAAPTGAGVADAVKEPEPASQGSVDTPPGPAAKPAPRAPNPWDLSDIRFQDEARP